MVHVARGNLGAGTGGGRKGAGRRRHGPGVILVARFLFLSSRFVSGWREAAVGGGYNIFVVDGSFTPKLAKMIFFKEDGVTPVIHTTCVLMDGSMIHTKGWKRCVPMNLMDISPVCV